MLRWRAHPFFRFSRQSAWTDCGKRSGGADRRSAFRGLVFFLGGRRDAQGLLAGAALARDRRDLAVGPDASEELAREGVYFNNVVSVAAELEKRGPRRHVSGLPPAALPCPCSCVRRHERERPQGPAGHRPEVPASGRSASSALSSAGESVQALHHVKISPIRISVECAGKALRQRAKPFRAAPWKSFL